MTRADRHKGGQATRPRAEREPMRPRAVWGRGVPCEDGEGMGDAPLGGRVWALRCAGVLCEAPSPDTPDHPAPQVGYMSANLKGVASDWPL